MTDSATDLADRLAHTWNASHDDEAIGVDFWPCYRILQEHGLVDAQQENLAAVSLGPFRLAVHRSGEPTRDFVEVLLPSVVASLPAGEPVAGAVSGALSAACLCFVKLLGNGVVFGRAELDRLRWDVLIHVRSRNAAGIRPSERDVVAALSDGSATRTTGQVTAAVDWLASDAPRIRLVVRHHDSGLECLV